MTARQRSACVACILPSAACDPLVNVAGAFFPAWLLCILMAVATTVGLRFVLARAGLERRLGPLVLVYPMLATGIALACWVVFYRR